MQKQLFGVSYKLITIDKLIEYNLKFIAISIPIFFIGFNLQRYPLSLPMMFICTLDVLLVIRGRYNKNILFSGLILILWALITNIGRNPISSYIPSWIAFILVIFPFWASYPKSIDRNSIGHWLIAGFLLSCIFAIYEIAGNFTNIPELKNLLKFGLWEEVVNPSIKIIKRVKASMQEPSYYAKYLNFLYIVVDSKQAGLILKKYRLILKSSILIILISTVSLTGYIMIIAYYVIKYFLSLKRKFQSDFKISPRYLLSFCLFVLLTIVILQNKKVNMFVEKNYDRINKLYSVIENEKLVGSEGSRGNAIIITWQYLTQYNASHFFFGEGYANHHDWLIKKYRYLGEYSAFSKGSLPNMFANVGMTMGTTGLLFFCFFLFSILSNKGNRFDTKFYFYLLFLLFSSGSLISYLVWSILLMSKILFIDEEVFNEEYKSNELG